MFTSEGVATFPDVNIDPKTEQARRATCRSASRASTCPRSAPTAARPRRSRPSANPVLFLTAYRGNLGVDAGLPGSVYALDRGQIAAGKLKQVSGARPHELKPGRDLDPGRRHEAGVPRHPAVRHARGPARPDPVAGARRRGARPDRADVVAVRAPSPGLVPDVAPRPHPERAPGGTLMEAGGLPRTDYPGFDDEFAGLVTSGEGRRGDRVMAELSNQLMAFTVLAYLAAMVCYAGEYAFGNRSHIGRAAARPARELVGAGAAAAGGRRRSSRRRPTAKRPGTRSRRAAVGSDRRRAQRSRRCCCTSAPWSPAASLPTGCPGATCTSSSCR